MKIAVIGCNGQLGRDMVTECNREGHSTVGIDYPDIDITDASNTISCIKTINPEVIINCSAFTAVDLCEKEMEKAFAVNADGIGHIAMRALYSNAKVVHFSTDYVFDGLKTEPYTENDLPNPQTVYGKSKLAGEYILKAITQNHFIFRIAWLYGAYGNNFVKTIRAIALERSKKNKPLKVVNDQYGTPTYTKEVCKQVLKTIPTNEFGLYHCTNEGECSWYDFARYIVSSLGISVDIVPCTTEEFPRPAPRPKYSVLENARLNLSGLNQMLGWKKAFDIFMEEFS